MTRRELLGMGAIAAAGVAARPGAVFARGGRRFGAVPELLAQMERLSGGRLGVAVLETGSGEGTGYRAEERFAMCSTFKMLLTAAVLQRVDAGMERMDRGVAVPPKPLLGNSPLTEKRAGGEMSISALCHAAMTRSDNTAANLLLGTMGGPEGLTRFARLVGDGVTRLDRTEPTLNEAAVGDPRDTTSPAAIVGDLRRLLLGDVLSARLRGELVGWMKSNTTGNDRLRAGLPAGWKVGDKTGSDGKTTTNDIAIVWPEGRPPVLVAAYLTECAGTEAKRNAVLAHAGRVVAEAVLG